MRRLSRWKAPPRTSIVTVKSRKPTKEGGERGATVGALSTMQLRARLPLIAAVAVYTLATPLTVYASQAIMPAFPFIGSALAAQVAACKPQQPRAHYPTSRSLPRSPCCCSAPGRPRGPWQFDGSRSRRCLRHSCSRVSASSSSVVIQASRRIQLTRFP